ncbi:hypothetical protein KFK09_001719 [Dendrobium nobile]|uniref:Uncharacterized protein n=1 Tax=Dendrobium nobile TaxID=94219 RepID=A0A8T3CBP3_DENNO|nr:hypothetical protein KFK09_001719 [Dendrobium nobile]
MAIELETPKSLNSHQSPVNAITGRIKDKCPPPARTVEEEPEKTKIPKMVQGGQCLGNRSSS